ncbi:DNA (cytosine-5)-methyltransferase 1 [Oxalobacteraceae bacterium GrIS 1.11]
MTIRFGSVCSGIEAASVAWEPLGWQAAWLAEIEKFPSSVLAHHYPHVPNLGDMTKIAALVRSGAVAAPDVLVGGTPCQAFSVAGLRNSLADARGQLSLSYVDLANAIDTVRIIAGQPAAVIVWENVPGVLSTQDNAFGCFVGALAGEDGALQPAGGKWTNAGCVFGPQRAVAWRILDAQYSGVAQRRRRVFVVASARTDFDPTTVLFEHDGVRRDIAPSREAGQIHARPFARCLAGCRWDVSGTGEVICMAHGQGGAEVSIGRCPTLTCNHEAPIAVYGTAALGCDGGAATEVGGGVAGCLRTISYAIQAGALRTNPNSGPDGIGVQADIAYTLEARAEVQAVCFSCKDHGADATVELAPTMRAMGHAGSHANAGGQLAVAFAQNTRDEVRLMNGDGQIVGALSAQPGMKQTCYVATCVTGEITHTLKAEGFDGSEDGTGRGHPIVAAYSSATEFLPQSSRVYSEHEIAPTLQAAGLRNGNRTPQIHAGMAVRRLTPRECERLQGFPDDFTLIPRARGSVKDCDMDDWLAYLKADYPSITRAEARLLAPDGHRYKALGNSMAVPCMSWIGGRINDQIGDAGIAAVKPAATLAGAPPAVITEPA